MKKILCLFFTLLLIILSASLWSELISIKYQKKFLQSTMEAENPGETVEENGREKMQPETQPETRSSLPPETQPETRSSLPPETQPETRPSLPPETQPEIHPSLPTDPEQQTESGKEIFLTVSEISLSLIGHFEDIYAGSLPREQVKWESRDPEIIQVKNGIITATGVGTTEIPATWKDQKVSCKASCLAKNRDALMALGYEVLQQPKRIPPDTPERCRDYFKDGAMVGDSITYGLMHWEKETGALGHPQFLARGGVSVYSLLDRKRLLYFRGKDCLLENAVSVSQPRAIFVLLGQNDLGFQKPKDVIRNMQTLMGRVRRKSPEVEIYLQSCLPVREKSSHYSGDNGILRDFNKLLKPFARSRNYHYVDVARYMENHLGSLPSQYSMDEIHPNEAGCKAWMAALRACLYMEELSAESGN